MPPGGNCLPDQALVVEFDEPVATYWSIQMYMLPWLAPLDFTNRVTSLNDRQVQVDPDRPVRFIISHNDPGVHNWLDTSGLEGGVVLLPVGAGQYRTHADRQAGVLRRRGQPPTAGVGGRSRRLVTARRRSAPGTGGLPAASGAEPGGPIFGRYRDNDSACAVEITASMMRVAESRIVVLPSSLEGALNERGNDAGHRPVDEQHHRVICGPAQVGGEFHRDLLSRLCYLGGLGSAQRRVRLEHGTQQGDRVGISLVYSSRSQRLRTSRTDSPVPRPAQAALSRCAESPT